MSNQLASNIMLFLSLTRQLNGGFQQCHRGRYTTGIISTPEILNPRDSFTKSLSVLPPGLSCWYSCCTLRKLRNGEHWWSFSSLYWGKGGDFPFLITKKSENSFNDFLRMSLSLQLYVKRQRKYKMRSSRRCEPWSQHSPPLVFPHACHLPQSRDIAYCWIMRHQRARDTASHLPMLLPDSKLSHLSSTLVSFKLSA